MVEPALALGPWVSPDEYLAAEAEAPCKHEYLAGTVVAMAGESANHNLLAGNLFAALHGALSGGPCRTFMADMKLRILNRAKTDVVFYYPDVMVGCDPADRNPQFLERPALLAEVSSPSTARIDLREKNWAYQTIPTLHTYVRLDQDSLRVWVHRRAADWVAEELARPADLLRVPEFGFEVGLEVLYRGVDVEHPAAWPTVER